MSKMEYMPVDCLQVPKVLFQMEKYKNLSDTAKILYSLFLDRLKFAVQNGWVDHNGNLFVIYRGGAVCRCRPPSGPKARDAHSGQRFLL